MAKEAIEKAKAKGVKLLLPVDNILADNFAADAKTQVWDCSVDFPDDWQGLDIGPKIDRGDRRSDFDGEDDCVERAGRRV